MKTNAAMLVIRIFVVVWNLVSAVSSFGDIVT